MGQGVAVGVGLGVGEGWGVAVGETAVATSLLQFIAAHPATERQYVREAEEMLAAAGVEVTAVPLDVVVKRPLATLIEDIWRVLDHL